jgi:hypothetical protein
MLRINAMTTIKHACLIGVIDRIHKKFAHHDWRVAAKQFWGAGWPSGEI